MEAHMTGATSPTGWTYEDYARLPDDGNKYEVLDGKVLVSPAPGTRHQRTAIEVFVRLREYVLEHRLGEMVWDQDLLFMSGQFLRPDMLFVPSSERHRLVERGMEGVPGLVVEVVSPSSNRTDKVTKPARYADFGVPQYWAVDPGKLAVLIWDFEGGATEPRIEPERVTWHPETEVPALELEVPPLFKMPG
jgi:Uma2 family endonuclease